MRSSVPVGAVSMSDGVGPIAPSTMGVGLAEITPAAVSPIVIVAVPLLPPIAWMFAGWIVDRTVRSGDRHASVEHRRGIRQLCFVLFLAGVVLPGAVLLGAREWIGVGSPPTTVVTSLVAVVIGIVLYCTDSYIWRWWSGRPGRGTARRVASSRRSGSSWPGAVARLLAAPIEELLYRGVLTALLVVGPFGYVLGSASLFAVAHAYLGRHELLFKGANGVVYAVGFLVSGSILVPIGMHLGYNVAAETRHRGGMAG